VKLRVLEDERYCIAAVVKSCLHGEQCPVTDFLKNAPPNMKSSAKGFKVLFERYAAMSRQGLTSDMFHEANKDEGIWEFVKGRLRVFCFLDRGDLVILTHGVIKKSQKASHSEVVHAVRVK
jgi:hypothetical protein